jgi:molybdate/tungstate transport system substrate-binding protein
LESISGEGTEGVVMLKAIRQLLFWTASVAIVWAGVTYCAQAQQTNQLNLCHAGSLSGAFAQVENQFRLQNPDVAVKDSSGGSLDLARQLANGFKECDIYATADYENIALLLQTAGLAEYDIVFAEGRMVLAYLASNPRAKGIAQPGDFNPPNAVPEAVPNWYEILLASGARIGGVHPFLDPGSYRSHFIFQLAQTYYKVPNLYNDLLKHYTIPASTEATSTTPTSDFQFGYEHSAQASAKRNPDYRYVHLPDSVDLSNTANNGEYSRATIVVPGLGLPGSAPSVTIPATRVAWGVTVLKNARNRENAVKFLQLLLGSAGASALASSGPAPITPPIVNGSDYRKLPDSLKSLVKVEKISP